MTDCADGSGAHGNPLLGKHSHVVDLNSLARDIARQHGWHVIDMERFTAPFHHHTFFLRDWHHPDGNILAAALNSMLNLYQSSCEASGAKQNGPVKHMSRLMTRSFHFFPHPPVRDRPDHDFSPHHHPPHHHQHPFWPWG